MTNLSGILPAVVTPFNDREEFDAAVFERLLQRLYDAGVDGIYLCGQTGEGLLQSVAARKRVAEVAVKFSPPGKIVIAHVGAHRMADAIELAKDAARLGVHAISSLPPIGGYTFAEVKAYYQSVAGASDLPLLIYYFPEVSQAIHGAAQILELRAIPNIVGLKFTDYDLFTMATVKKAGQIVFFGRDEMLVAGLLMHADGGIGSFYNLIPDLFVKLYRLARAQKWDEAVAVQQSINEMIEIVTAFPIVPAMKAILAWSGIDCGPCAGPRRSLSTAEKADLRSRLSKAKLSYPGPR